MRLDVLESRVRWHLQKNLKSAIGTVTYTWKRTCNVDDKRLKSRFYFVNITQIITRWNSSSPRRKHPSSPPEVSFK